MKIKKLVCLGPIANLKERPSTIFGQSKDPDALPHIHHKIDYNKEMNVFIIDDILIIPMDRVMEVVLDEPFKEPKAKV